MLIFMISTIFGCGILGGGGACDVLADVAESCGTPPSEAEIAQCEEALANCTAEDEDKLIAFIECSVTCDDDTTTTEESTGLEGIGDLFACSAEFEGISEECVGAWITLATND